MTTLNLRTGTSGFSYKEWKGSFYPEKHPNAQMLEFYATKLPAVEINNTFYRMPKVSVLEGWTEKVPENFRFILKASRRITHFKRLVNTDDELGYFVETSQALGQRLGALLFQLPPNFKKDLERLETFLKLLPNSAPAAFEFRHDSWFDEETYGALRKHNRALCLADTEDKPAKVVRTADWGYLRLRRPDYSKKDLERWQGQIEEQGWGNCYVFFKHEDEASGPRLAQEFLAMAGG